MFEDVYDHRQTWTLFALAGASVIFEKRGVLCSGATWKQHDKECTRSYFKTLPKTIMKQAI
jgi:hypothetical protein